jgi:hypothetical protein
MMMLIFFVSGHGKFSVSVSQLISKVLSQECQLPGLGAELAVKITLKLKDSPVLRVIALIGLTAISSENGIITDPDQIKYL